MDQISFSTQNDELNSSNFKNEIHIILQHFFHDAVSEILEIKLPETLNNKFSVYTSQVSSTSDEKEKLSFLLSLREHKDYEVCSKALIENIKPILYSNRKILRQLIKTFIQSELVPDLPNFQQDLTNNRTSLSKFIPSLGWRIDHDKLFNSSFSIIPKIRCHFSNIIQNYFTLTNNKNPKIRKKKFTKRRSKSCVSSYKKPTVIVSESSSEDNYDKIPYDVKNWLTIASINMIGLLIIENYREICPNVHKNYTICVIRLIGAALSDYCISNHLHFFEMCGWQSLKVFGDRQVKNDEKIYKFGENNRYLFSRNAFTSRSKEFPIGRNPTVPNSLLSPCDSNVFSISGFSSVSVGEQQKFSISDRELWIDDDSSLTSLESLSELSIVSGKIKRSKGNSIFNHRLPTILFAATGIGLASYLASKKLNT